jgi:hypothetical protein
VSTPDQPVVPIVVGTPSQTPTRSFALLVGTAVAAFALLVTSAIGQAGYPAAAPVEQLYAFGIAVDLLAITVVSAIGAVFARRRYPLRPTTPLTFVAVVLAAVALVAFLAGGGIAAIVQLAAPGLRGRYMFASQGLFYTGAVWVLAVVFASHGYRRFGDRRSNTLAVAALAAVAVPVLFVVASSVLYGLGLTD